MARSLTSDFASALTAGTVLPAMLVEGLFDSGAVRLWTGIGDLSWNSYTWTGAGTLLGIDSISEKGTVEALGTTITLSGIPSDLVSLALQEPYQGRLVKIYLLLFSVGTAADGTFLTDQNDNYLTTDAGERLFVTLTPASPGGGIISSPDERFTGRADVMALSEDGKTATLSLTVESRLIDLLRPRMRRYTNEDQQTYYPSDRGFEFVAAIQDQELTWGNR